MASIVKLHLSFMTHGKKKFLKLCAAFCVLPDVALHFHQTSVLFDWWKERTMGLGALQWLMCSVDTDEGFTKHLYISLGQQSDSVLKLNESIPPLLAHEAICRACFFQQPFLALSQTQSVAF